MENLKWYVKNYDFNKKVIEDFNIFRSVKFTEGLQEILDKNDYTTFEDFVEKVRQELMYAFWSKCEYEVMIGDLFDTIETKIDIYDQVKPNIEILSKYILDNYKK